MKTISELLAEKEITNAELAGILGVHITQIYKWNKSGIAENNPHFHVIKELLPDLESTGIQKRSNCGRKKKDEIPYLKNILPYRPDLQKPNYDLKCPNLVLEGLWKSDYKKIAQHKLDKQPDLEGASLEIEKGIPGPEIPRKSSFPKIITREK